MRIERKKKSCKQSFNLIKTLWNEVPVTRNKVAGPGTAFQVHRNKL